MDGTLENPDKRVPKVQGGSNSAESLRQKDRAVHAMFMLFLRSDFAAQRQNHFFIRSNFLGGHAIWLCC